MTGSSMQSDRERPLGLVVDDHRDGREIACRVLQSLGLQTMEAGNGHEALDQARQHAPDLLILDLALPGLDGWTVAERLRADPAMAGLLIIAFTAHAETQFLDRAREVGCDAVLTKPCPPRQLAESVRTLLESRTVPERRQDA